MAGLLERKVMLVTGAAGGIGRATAQLAAREGAAVMVSDVSEEGGRETVQLIAQAGGEASFVRCDVSRAGAVERLVDSTLASYGALHCAHNNAGIEGARVPLADQREEDFDAVIATNLKGIWLCMKYELAQMLQAGGGAIVNTASAAGLVGAATMPIYAASKHGVVGLTKSAALAYADRNIRVNCVCPGIIDTPMLERAEEWQAGFTERALRALPNRRLGTPEEVAASVVWLCSDAASLVTGHALAVDGGIVAQ